MALHAPALQPLPYHVALADYLNTAEREAWDWFSSTRAQQDYADALRLDLLKSTYRLEPHLFPEAFAMLDRARTNLTPDLPVTLYQSQGNAPLNASIFCLPGEAHIVFSGNVLQLLSSDELLGVFGHELAHYRLWQEDGRRHFITDRLAQAMAADPRAEPSHVETARQLRLHTEIYADRGAYCATGDAGPVITGLVKMNTGLTQVDAVSYIRQADEVFARAKVRTDALSHPEEFIRTRALKLWCEGAAAADTEIARMLEAEPNLQRLDLLGQRRLTAWSERWLRLLTTEAWWQTDPVLGHARLFFPDFAFGRADHRDDELVAALADLAPPMRDYFCYLLLDFAAIDPELEDEAIKSAFRLAQRVDWAERLEALLVKELKLKKKEARRLRDESAAPPVVTPPRVP